MVCTISKRKNHWHWLDVAGIIPINIHLSMLISGNGTSRNRAEMEKNFVVEMTRSSLYGEWPWKAIRSAAWEPCARRMCLCCVFARLLVFLLPSPLIARFDLSRLYNFSRLSRIFIENENKWVFFIPRDWSGRDKFAIPSIFSAQSLEWDHSNKSYIPDCWWRD